jgi:phage terminase large subunit
LALQQHEEVQNQDDIVTLIQEWQTDPYRFVIEAIGAKPTNQQTHALDELGKLVSAKLKRHEGKPTTPEEDEYIAKIGLSIMSGKGTGKDAMASWIMLWFLCCFRNSKQPITGPSRDQLRDVFMSETSKWVNRMDANGDPCFLFRDNIVLQADKIYMKDPDNPNEEGKSWFARLRTAPKSKAEEEQSKTMDGLHADFMMIIVDEADGVQASVITSLETTLTDPVNFMVAIFNPTKNYGYAYETHYGERSKYWIRLHWDARKSDNVDPLKIARDLDTYGEDSYEFRVNVCGLPPEQSPDTLVPREWIDHACEKEPYEEETAMRIMGVDPSLQGGDPAGIIIRDGWQITELIEITKTNDTIELADQLAEIFTDFSVDMMFIDCIGNGAGVFHILKRRFPGKVRGVDVSTKTTDKRKRYARLRDELYWKVRESFEQNLVTIPPKHRLTKKFVNELTIMKRDEDDTNGRIKIEGKAKMKARGLKSPNLVEAFMVTLASPDAAVKSNHKPTKPRDKYREAREAPENFDRNWLVA